MPRVTEKRPWLSWYSTAAWKHIRRWQLAQEPLCRMCAEVGDTTAATVCDHIEPHRGDAEKFWSGPFQSLCAAHHSRDKQREENGRKVMRYGADGYPI